LLEGLVFGFVNAADGREVFFVSWGDGGGWCANPGIERWRGIGAREAEAGKEWNEGERRLAGACVDAFDVVCRTPDARDAFLVVAEFVLETRTSLVTSGGERIGCALTSPVA